MGRTVAAEIEKPFVVFVDDDAAVVIAFVVLGYGPGRRVLDQDHWLA